jgi:hypothetical protein
MRRISLAAVLATAFMLFFSVAAFAQAENQAVNHAGNQAGNPASPEESAGARIDFYSENWQFDLEYVTSNGGIQPAPWKAEAQRKTQYMAQLPLNANPHEWCELWVEFTPRASGSVFIEARGRYFNDLKANKHEVFVDDVSVEGKGASIKNGGFENYDPKTGFHDWGSPCLPKDVIRTEKGQAHTGQAYANVWHDCPMIQKFNVEAGNKYKIHAWFKPAQ